MDENNRNYLMVRAMSSQQAHFDEFFNNKVVAIGWKDVKFIDYCNNEDLRVAVEEKYLKGKDNRYIGKKLNECVRFKEIKKGDYIIVPCYSGIALAVAQGEELYSELASASKLDLCNQQKVEYKYNGEEILCVPRKSLSEGLQRRLRVQGRTVSDLKEFSEGIDKLFENTKDYSYYNVAKEKEDNLLREFSEKLLCNIKEGKTNLPAGGEGLELLVKELFECQGYNASKLWKKYFPEGADADVKAWKDDDFLSTNIYAQVKHHSGYTGKQGIDQIINAIKYEEEKTGEKYIGILVTSANILEEDRKYAIENNITVIDGERLVEIILSNLERLKDETKMALGILSVPSVFDPKEKE